jgi:hypothetical protein
MKKRSSIMKDISMSNTQHQLSASITTVANDSLTTIKGRLNKIDTGSFVLNDDLQEKNIDQLTKRKYEYTLTYDKDKKIKKITSEKDYPLALLAEFLLLFSSCIPLPPWIDCNDDEDDEITLEVQRDNTFRIAFKQPDVFINFEPNDQTQDFDFEFCYRECLGRNQQRFDYCNKQCYYLYYFTRFP